MNVTPTAGIAAAWSAAKSSPSDQATQLANSRNQARTNSAPEAKKAPPAPDGQGTRVDVRV
jgi:hypothetical protein